MKNTIKELLNSSDIDSREHGGSANEDQQKA